MYPAVPTRVAPRKWPKWLGLPVVLVVGARSQARELRRGPRPSRDSPNSIPSSKIAGVVANRVGSDAHARVLNEAMESTPGLPPLLGCLPRRDGILPAGAAPRFGHRGRRGCRRYCARNWRRERKQRQRQPLREEEHLDLDAFLDLATSGVRFAGPAAALEEEEKGAAVVVVVVRIGVARDRAFCFHYPENLRLLEAAGAELVEFSPLEDRRLPSNLDGLYLGGGYPELHAEKLAANESLREDVKLRAEAGMPVYAECGGFMYLCMEIDGHHMCGVFSELATSMLPRLRALGYRQVEMVEGTPIGPAGIRVRGHEFRYSEVTEAPKPQGRGEAEGGGGAAAMLCYRTIRRDGSRLGTEGYRINNVLGSYVHLHFGSNPRVAGNFVGSCLDWKRSNRKNNNEDQP